ncbi:MAG: response regulator transcription factor [Phycisphaeraceae bacterium]|nr:response regulator transcription factor [Phycisphaeraceae bacterium]
MQQPEGTALPASTPTPRTHRPIAVLPVARQRLVGAALREGLIRAGFDCLPESQTPEAALELARLAAPDVVVLDVSASHPDPAAAVLPWSTLDPPPRIIVIDDTRSDRSLRRCLLAGARAYLLLSDPESTLVEAIGSVLKGQIAISPEARPRLVTGESHPPGYPLTRGDLLSPRERQVMAQIAEGRSKRQIAEILRLSVKTVEKHSTSLMRKLDLHNRVEVARYAVREGIADR